MAKKVQGFAFELDEGLISEDQCTYALHFINSTNKQNWLRDPWVEQQISYICAVAHNNCIVLTLRSI